MSKDKKSRKSKKEEEDVPNQEDGDELHLRPVLQSVPIEFKDPAFNPIPTVIKILQEVTVENEGHGKLEELENKFDDMEASMNLSVEAYYQGFNKTIKNYSQILQYVTTSQKNVQVARANIERTRKYLYSRSNALRKMWRQNLEYKEMIRILDKIEELKQVRPKLETYINGKHYLYAAEMLIKSVNQLFGEDLLEVRALEDLRKDLLERKNTFHELLIEELQDMIYLRKYQFSDDIDDMEAIAKEKQKVNASIMEEVKDDITQDPLQNSHEFMKMILEALHVLDRLPTALSALNSQSALHLRSVAFSTVNTLRESKESTTESFNQLARLLNSLFPKYLRIIRNHIYLSAFITKRYLTTQEEQTLSPKSRKYTSNPYNLDGVWLVMQREIESLLLLHLEGQAPNNPSIASKGLSKIDLRPKERLFSFANSSAATFKEFKNQASVISSNSLPDPIISPTPYNIPVIYSQFQRFEEKLLKLFGALESSLSSTELHNFIDEYIVNNFLPHMKIDFSKRLEKSLEGLSKNSKLIITGSDAFKILDKQKLVVSSEEASKTTLQSAADVLSFIQELYTDIQSMPKYADKFANIIETTIIKFTDKCRSRFGDAVGDSECAKRINNQEFLVHLSNDPLWKSINSNPNSLQKASNPETGSSISSGSHDENDSESYRDSEFATESNLYLHNSPSKFQLIIESHKFILLAALNDSLEWLVSKIDSMSSTTSILGNDKKKAKKTVGIIGVTKKTNNPTSFSKYVPNIEFLQKQLRQLHDTCLFALRTELRLHCYHYLDQVKRTNYSLDEEPNEPDSFVVDLNKDISIIEEAIVTYMSKAKLRYLFDGLAHLMSNILIKSLKKIKHINRNGIQRMLRNVFALQQNLTNIIQFKETHFDKVRKYYRLLYVSEEEILATVQSQSTENSLFTLEDYKVVLSVQQSRDQKTFNERVFNLLEDFLQKAKRGVSVLT